MTDTQELSKRAKTAIELRDTWINVPPKQILSLLDRLDKAEARVKFLELAASKTNETTCQILGKVLGFPWYKDDEKNFPRATEADGICAGNFLAEDMANLAASTVLKLEAENKAMREALKPFARIGNLEVVKASPLEGACLRASFDFDKNGNRNILTVAHFRNAAKAMER